LFNIKAELECKEIAGGNI